MFPNSFFWNCASHWCCLVVVFLLSLSHSLIVFVSCFHCLCRVVIVSLSLSHCPCVVVVFSLSLPRSIMAIVSFSRCLCLVFVVLLSLSHCHFLFVLLSLLGLFSR